MKSKYLEWLDKVNNQQRRAILDQKGHCIVKAGPGTGKTRTLVLKAATLLYEEIFPPRGLACVTYTQAMATELRVRLKKLGVSRQQNVFIGTLHGFCLTYILSPFARRFEYPLPEPIKIISASEQAKIYERLWDGFNEKFLLSAYEPEYRNGELVERLPIAFQKYRRINLDGLASDKANPHVEHLVEQYEAILLKRQCIDFDLQVKWSMKLVEREKYVRKALQAKFPWLLVDEYQDVGLPLHRMVKALTQETGIKLFAIGDTNQCIYSFSGASPDYLEELCQITDNYGDHIILTKNYRSRRKILQAAEIMALEPISLEQIRKDGDGVVEVFETDRLIDILRTLTQRAGIPPKDIMILHRKKGGCGDIVRRIRESDLDIPYFNAAQELYDYRRPLLDWLSKLMAYTLLEVSDTETRFQESCWFWQMLLTSSGLSIYDAASLKYRLLLFCTLERSQQHMDSAFNWLEYVSEALDLETLLRSYKLKAPDELDEYRKLQEAFHPDGDLAGFSLQRVRERVIRQDRIYIGTLHSSKGQENGAVIIADTEALNVGGNDVERQEENRRLFFVGVTRAKNQLYITQNGFAYLAKFLRQGLSRVK